MPKIFKVFAVLAFLLLINCGEKKINHTQSVKDGVKFIANKNIPAQKLNNADILKLKPLYSFSQSSLDSLGELVADFNSIYNVQMDKAGDLYFYSRDYSLYKITDKGLKIAKILTAGQGPSEIPHILTYCLDDNFLYVTSGSILKKFDLAGNYIDQFQITEPYIFILQMFKRSNELIFSGKKFEKKTDDILFSSTLDFFYDNLKLKRSFSEHEYSYRDRPFAGYFSENTYAFGKQKIYRSYREKNQYKVSVLDYDGEVTEVITKNYRKEKYSEADYAELKKLNPETPLDKEFYDYQLAIHELHIDKLENLWVQETFNNFSYKNMKFSIFTKGIYQATFESNFEEPQNDDIEIKFLNDKLIVVNSSELKITVYEYELGI